MSTTFVSWKVEVNMHAIEESYTDSFRHHNQFPAVKSLVFLAGDEDSILRHFYLIMVYLEFVFCVVPDSWSL